MTQLEQRLDELNGEILRRLARRMGVLEKGMTRKQQFAAVIHQHVTHRLPEFLNQLTDTERLLLSEAVHLGRVPTEREFVARRGTACPLPKAYYSWNEEPSLLTAVIHRSPEDPKRRPTLLPDVAEALRRALPAPDPPTIRTVERPSEEYQVPPRFGTQQPPRRVHVFEGAQTAPVELQRVLQLIQAGQVKVTGSTRRPTEATTRLVAGTLVVPDFDLEKPAAHRTEWDQRHYQAAGPVRAHAWPVLAQQCGWARDRAGTLGLTAAGKALLQGFSPEEYRAGVARFLAEGDFDELNRVNHLRGQGGKGQRWVTSPGQRRTGILEALRQYPVDRWLEFGEAQRLVVATGNEWQVIGDGAGVFFFAERHYGTLYDGAGISYQYLRALFMESLATLGLMDIGYVFPHRLWPNLGDAWGIDELAFCGRYDGLLYVRLNALGAYALGFQEAYAAEPADAPGLFRIQPDLRLEVAVPELNPADRATLELAACPAPDGTWAIDDSRLLQHWEQGGSLDELRDFLAQHAVDAVPDELPELFASITRQAAAFRSAQPAVLLQWADEGHARRIAAHPETQRWCRHAGDAWLAVDLSHLHALRRALRKLGYALPAHVGVVPTPRIRRGANTENPETK